MGETSAVDRAVPTTARLLWRCSGCCFRRFQRASQRCSGRCSTTYRSSRRRQLRDGLRRAVRVTRQGRDNVKWRLAVNFDWRTYVCMFVWSQKLVGINESWRYLVA